MSTATKAAGRLAWRPELSTETLCLFASVFFALACNGLFWRAALNGRALGDAHTWLFGASLLVLVVGLHFIVLALVVNRYTAKPLLTLLLVATAFAVFYMQRFTVFLDPSMLRNVLRTDVKEAGELFGWSMVPHLLLYAVLPIALLWRVRIRTRTWLRAGAVRLGVLLLAVGVAVLALFAAFQDLSALMRNQKEVRYLITPGNFVYSTARALATDAQVARKPREVIGADARMSAAATQRARPVFFVVVVGETARAANWGLNGYARQTTPELAQRDVISFTKTTSCGTNTEVSVPCMFSAWGLRDYDYDRIRGSESLLHVLNRAGLAVRWRDNQAGCKGVCDGLPEERLDRSTDAQLCEGDRCLDEILLKGLDGIAAQPGNQVVVLHQLGNHGPAYYRRYPPAFKRFTPTCDTSELNKCSVDEIVNAYDNALLYTDHVLARAVDLLKSLEATHDTALLYVSDHGESLGENRLFLHGIPRSIAPRVQIEVPMLMWFSKGFAESARLDLACLRGVAGQPSSHDNLFHTVLGLLGVETRVYERAMDLSAACRR